MQGQGQENHIPAPIWDSNPALGTVLGINRAGITYDTDWYQQHQEVFFIRLLWELIVISSYKGPARVFRNWCPQNTAAVLRIKVKANMKCIYKEELNSERAAPTHNNKKKSVLQGPTANHHMEHLLLILYR